MTGVHETLWQLAVASWRSLTWGGAEPVRDQKTPAPAVCVREGVIELFVERIRETGARVTRVSAEELHAGSFPADAALVHATLGVATAGAVVLPGDQQPGQHQQADGQRSAAPATPKRVCVLHVSTLVAGVPEAVTMLDPHRAHTWVRGAAAEPDLELDRIDLVRDEPDLQVLLVS